MWSSEVLPFEKKLSSSIIIDRLYVRRKDTQTKRSVKKVDISTLNKKMSYFLTSENQKLSLIYFILNKMSFSYKLSSSLFYYCNFFDLSTFLYIIVVDLTWFFQIFFFHRVIFTNKRQGFFHNPPHLPTLPPVPLPNGLKCFRFWKIAKR